MSTATPLPWPGFSGEETAGITFRAFFEHAPIAMARCNREGVIVQMNPAFERSLDPAVASRRSLRLNELVSPQDREKTELLLRDVLASRQSSVGIEARGAGHGQASAKWRAWRQAASGGEPDHALLIAEPTNDIAVAGELAIQTHRWEAIGRLTGGVVHDFNNLLTGVTLYCDLLLSSLDSRDRRRRYADEIKSAIGQATDLVRQLLLCARPETGAPQFVSLNEISVTMRDLLTRLVGENIVLEMRLDPELGSIKIARAHAQQILLNLVLNARDALPKGGRITVETKNCRFQPVAGTNLQSSFPALPCVLLMVGDDGHGMDVHTRRHLFEPFFTTKPAAKGSGLGLTTVCNIVTTNQGLIHIESEPGRGTRAMILFPRSAQPNDSHHADSTSQSSEATSSTVIKT